MAVEASRSGAPTWALEKHRNEERETPDRADLDETAEPASGHPRVDGSLWHQMVLSGNERPRHSPYPINHSFGIRMSYHTLVEHYEQFLRTGASGITEGFAWTVVRPVVGQLSLEETAVRATGGGRAFITELDVDDAVYRDDAILLNQSGPTTMLVEIQSSRYASAHPVLQWLSMSAQVWNLTWDISRNFRLTYAAHGQVLAEISGIEVDTVAGLDPRCPSRRVSGPGPYDRSPVAGDTGYRHGHCGVAHRSTPR